jgi:hypothetical protein
MRSLCFMAARAAVLALFSLLLFSLATAIRAEDFLQWNTSGKSVSARFEDAPLSKVLERIAAASGWQIYIEPGFDRSVSVRFRDRSPGEALLQILSDMNFALIPQPAGPARLYIFRTSVNQATQEIAPGRPGSIIPNELLVSLSSDSTATIESLAGKLGAEIVGRSDELNIYRLRFADADAAQAARDWLETNPSFGNSDSNHLIPTPDQPDFIPARGANPFSLSPAVNHDGSHVIVGLIDTAVQPLDPVKNEFFLPAIHVAGDPLFEGNQPLHGTSMADTLLQSLAAGNESGSSSVRILPVDIYGPHGETTSFDVIKGVHAAISSGATIINLSIGGDGESPLLANLIQQAHQQGVLFFGAAGNQPTGQPFYPAAYSQVLSVTASDKRGQLAPYANHGDFVDLIAPGTSLVQFGDQAYVVTGTSTATAIVSGAAAAARADGRTPAEVEAFLRQVLSVQNALQP